MKIDTSVDAKQAAMLMKALCYEVRAVAYGIRGLKGFDEANVQPKMLRLWEVSDAWLRKADEFEE